MPTEAEQKYKTIFDLSPEAIVLLDTKGKVLDVNGRVYDWLGYKPEEITGKTLTSLSFLSKKSKVKVMKKFLRRMLGKEIPPYELEFTTKKGEKRIGLIHATPIKDENGKIIGDFVMISDITERKKVDEAIRESEEKLRTIIGTINDVIFQLSPLGFIKYVSPNAKDLYGYKPEELIGKHLKKTTPMSDVPKASGALKSVLTGKTIKHFEINQVTSKGEIIPMEINLTSVKKEGKIIAVQGVMRNITERKQAEEKLKHLNLVLRTIRNVNQLIARERDSGRLLKNICKTIIENRGYHHAWIVLINKNGQFTLAVEAGLGTKFTALVKKLKGGEIPNCGKRTLKRSGVVIIKNPKSSCTGCPLTKVYHNKAAMATRLEHNGKVYGLLSVSLSIDLIADKEEHSLFEEVAGDIAFALYNRELEDKRKQAEQALKISEQRFRTIFDEASDGILLADTETRKFYTGNKMICQMLGYSLEEIKNLGVMDIHPKENLPHLIEQFEKQQRGEIKVVKDIPLKRKDGGVVYADVNSTMIMLKGKTYLTGFFRDVTEHKQAETKIRRLSSVVEQSSEGMAVADLEGNLLFVNKSWVQMHGYVSKEELIGKHLKIFHNQEQLEQDVIPFNQKTKEKGFNTGEVGHIRKDGTPFPTMMTTTMLKDEQGNPYGLVGIAKDITELKRAAEALRESEEKYRTITENVSVGIYRTSPGPKGKFIEANPAMIKMFGYKNKEEFVKITVADLYQDPKQRKKFNEKMIKDGLAKNEEARFKKKDGTIFICLDSALAVKDEKGEVKYYDGFIDDITKRKRAEEKLVTTMKELEDFNRLAVDRELRMIELKEEINKLLAKHSIEQKYEIVK